MIGPLTLHSFGLMVALGFLCSYFVIVAMVRRGLFPGLREDDVSRLVVLAMVGGAAGARIAYVCEHWSAEFAGQPFLEMLRFDKGGLMFYGGLIGAVVVAGLFLRVGKVPVMRSLDACATALPLGHAFGRVGCFLNGCCFGRACDSPISVTFPAHSPAWWEHVGAGLIGRGAPESLPVLPSQLIEAAANLVLFALLVRAARRVPREGYLSGVYLVSYAVIRFCTEMLRGDPRMSVMAMSISQFLSVAALVAGAVLIALSRGKAAED
jgi:phosphatidylglycerol:prolipoprotein diacylglycerol transferase